MNRSGGGALALALLVAVWAGSGSMRSSEPAPSQTGKPAVQQTAATQPNTKRQTNSTSRYQSLPYGDGFHDEGQLLVTTLADATSTTLSDDDQKELSALLTAVPKSEGKVGFMIALAPNPVRTHLSLTFDRIVDSLEQALQDSGFDFDRALLPWDNHEHTEPDNYLLRAGEDDYRRHAEMVPGVLIFRRHQKAKVEGPIQTVDQARKHEGSALRPVQILVVFVVDDMPTSGVDRTQFEVALALGKTLSHDVTPGNLLIVGPSFSGSLASLKDLLSFRPKEFQQTVIASGQVSGKESIDAFKDQLANYPVNFASFQENEQSLLNHLYEYSCSQWRLKPEEIALLSETETAFGRQPSKPVDTDFSPDCARYNTEDRTPLTLHFPRGIYHIRTAYERQFSGSTTSDDAVRQIRSTLRPNLEESRASADTIPDFSLQSPVSQEAVLMGVVDELQRRKSQLVVLMASDSLDTLFLVRYLRKNYAYGRLVILSPDLLLRHESEEPEMRGLMTLSPYSVRPGEDAAVQLASDEKHGSREEAAEITFADDGEKGTYNATTALAACLEDPSILWCSRKMSSPPDNPMLPNSIHFVDYGPSQLQGNTDGEQKQACCQAQIHIDTLGRDGYWPVATLRPGKQSWLPLEQGKSSPQDFEVIPPVTWKAAAAAALACFALVLICLERASLLGSFEPELLLAPAGLEASGSHGVKRVNLMTLLCICWAGLLSLVLWPLCAPEFRGNVLAHVIALAAAVVYSWFLCILIRRYRRPMWPVHLVTVGIVLVACWISQCDGFRVFFIQYVNLGSGISPLLPLLLVVLSLAWWAWNNIAGSVLTDLRRPLLPRSDPDHSHNRPLLPDMLSCIGAEEQHRLECVMGPAYPDRRISIPIACVMFVALLLIFPSRPLRSMDHFSYDYVMIGLLVVSFVLLVESILRGMMVWTDAKRLLRSIDAQPFANMISRQDGFNWTSIWKIGAGLIDFAHRLIVPEMEALKVAQEKAPASLCQRPLFPEEEVKDVWGSYLLLLAWRRKREQSPSHPDSHGSGAAHSRAMEDKLLVDFQKLQRKLADAAAVLLTHLQDGYQSHPAHQCEVDAEAVKKLRATPLETWEEWSEHYVSLVYINYIITILLRIRTLAMAAVGIFVLDVLAISSYPFEPRAILRTFMITIFVGLTICFGYVYAQMHRDRTLSRITDTRPEELGADFWFRMLGVTGLPLLSLVATEFPSIGNFLFSWIEPAMKALR